jgi:hypothetical protein
MIIAASMGGGGRAAPNFACEWEPKNIGARSALARSAA